MVDVVDQATRSRMMSGIGPENTRPEMRVRKYLHRRSLRYKLHDRRLPGRPDLVFPALSTVVFVHGCFWHRHPGCRYATTPTTRPAFWQEKLRKNVERDERNRRSLETHGWKVLTIWECQTKDPEFLDNLAEVLLALRGDIT